ncbi:plasmolipin [Protopterus annectens]|uniref:plasmolipin n=1 Tax=Protopterus annectens TaxID=7888 RepID=UPI001CFC42B5|nr:plasmolipin [Protopterus annectens]
MADFPSKISTQTSSPNAQASGRTLAFGPVSVDMDFLRSFVGLLMVVEIVLGLLVWALIAGSYYGYQPAYGWVMFVAVTCWLISLILFVLYLLQLHHKLLIIPWSLVLLGFHASATALYVTAFLTCAASVDPTSYRGTLAYNNRAAASFFACLVMIAYGASTFFYVQEWRGQHTNAATSQASGPNPS